MVCVVGWLQEHDISHHFIFKHRREHPQIYQVAKFLVQIVLRHQLSFGIDEESIN